MKKAWVKQYSDYGAELWFGGSDQGLITFTLDSDEIEGDPISLSFGLWAREEPGDLSLRSRVADRVLEALNAVDWSDTMIAIERGHIYRAKKPKFVGLYAFYNDRAVLYLSETCVQYDSPTIGSGRKYPTIDRAKFEAWVGSDVTEGYPEDWARKGQD